jgi:YfiH family protein
MPEQTQRFLALEWDLPEGVEAFSTTRIDGESPIPFDSFNIATHVGDKPELVSDNRRKLPLHQNIVWLNQTHGIDCVEIDSGTLPAIPKADASYTHESQTVCAVMTADCVPLLICDTHATVVAAVHAGWRGLAAGVIEKAISQLNQKNSELMVWIGPAISQSCFEVSGNVVSAFKNFPNAIKTAEQPNKYLIDLKAISADKCRALGIRNITISPYCSFTDQQQFFSHRRAMQQGLSSTGRMLSAIYLTKPNSRFRQP